MIEWIIIIFVCIILYYTGFFDDLFSNTPSTDSDSSSNSTPDSDNTDEKPKLGSRLIGVKTDNTIHIKENINAPWVPIQRVGKATGSTNGLGSTKALGINTDTLFDENIKAKSVVQLNSGMLLALTINNELYTKDSLSSSTWSKVQAAGGINNIALRSVLQLKDKRIIGISRDNKMYIKNSLLSPWEFLVNTDCIALSQLSDGTILGYRYVNNEHKLFSKTTLTGLWNELQNSGLWDLVAYLNLLKALFNGDIIGTRVGIDFTVIPNVTFKTRTKTFNSSSYATGAGTYIMDAIVTSSGRIMPYRNRTVTSFEPPLPNMLDFPSYNWTKYIKVATFREANGQVRLILIDNEGLLYSTNTFYPDETNFFTNELRISRIDEYSSTIQRFEDIHQLDDNTILAIEYTSGLLYTRQNWISDWVIVGETAIEIQQISTLPSGKILGVSKDNKLYFKSKLDSPWERENNTINIIYTSILTTGYRLGVFTNYNIYTSVDGGKTWTKVENTIGVKAACQMSDKQIIAIGASDGKIKIKEILESEESWKTLDDTCCWISIQNLF